MHETETIDEHVAVMVTVHMGLSKMGKEAAAAAAVRIHIVRKALSAVVVTDSIAVEDIPRTALVVVLEELIRQVDMEALVATIDSVVPRGTGTCLVLG